MTRRNQVIQKLINGETVLSTIPIGSGNFGDMIQLSESKFDMVIVEMEHQGFDFPNLRTSFQYLMSRRKVIERGPVLDPTPFVRIPPNTREQNQWIIKQALDAGAAGLVLPHFDTVEGAQAAVRAARYPQVRGSERMEPAGLRGFDFGAAQYWGMSTPDYLDAAGIWPLDPEGEILLMGIVETVAGIKALPDILSQVKGVGAVWAGQGDLSVSMGLRGEVAHPEVEKELLNILKIANDHGVACATAVTSAATAVERIEQGFQIVLIPTRMNFEQLNKACDKLGR